MKKTLLSLATACLLSACQGARTESQTQRAIAYLSQEVAAWTEDNGCFSCHHNGDAVRALFLAYRSGYSVTPSTWRATLGWLSDPSRWHESTGDPAFSDPVLARLQFTAAHAAAAKAGLLGKPGAAPAAGELAAPLQAADGSWPIEPRDAPGSPVTWGTHLTTALMAQALEAIDADLFRASIGRARGWLERAPCRSTLEAAAILIGLTGESSAAAASRRSECLGFLEAARTPSGSWGPYLDTPAEPFDTAIAMLALRRLPPHRAAAEWIAGGRAYLLAAQQEDGSWPATTRPRGGISHAQSTSTTAWAVQALLLTEP